MPLRKIYKGNLVIIRVVIVHGCQQRLLGDPRGGPPFQKCFMKISFTEGVNHAGGDRTHHENRRRDEINQGRSKENCVNPIEPSLLQCNDIRLKRPYKGQYGREECKV